MSARAWFATCVVTIAVGCGESRRLGDLPEGMELDEAAAQFCTEMRRIECQANLGCCRREKLRWPNEAACVAASDDDLEECRIILGGIAFRDGRVAFNAQGGERYLAKLREAANNCTDFSEDEADVRALFDGTLEEGASCTSLARDPSPAFACRDGLYCDEVSTNDATCRAIGNEGDACTRNVGCTGALYCAIAADAREGVCRAKLSSGSTCEDGDACESGNCTGGTCSNERATLDYCEHEPVTPGNWCFGGVPGSGSPCTTWWSTCRDMNEYKVECREEGSTVRCQCSKNTVLGQSFETTTFGFCTQDIETQTAAAREGCGWDIQVY